MSQESTTPDLVELVRVILEAADRADFDTILDFYAPDAVWLMADADLTFEGRCDPRLLGGVVCQLLGFPRRPLLMQLVEELRAAHTAGLATPR